MMKATQSEIDEIMMESLAMDFNGNINMNSNRKL
jgi:hypothetical protein